MLDFWHVYHFAGAAITLVCHFCFAPRHHHFSKIIGFVLQAYGALCFIWGWRKAQQLEGSRHTLELGVLEAELGLPSPTANDGADWRTPVPTDSQMMSTSSLLTGDYGRGSVPSPNNMSSPRTPGTPNPRVDLSHSRSHRSMSCFLKVNLSHPYPYSMHMLLTVVQIVVERWHWVNVTMRDAPRILTKFAIAVCTVDHGRLI